MSATAQAEPRFVIAGVDITKEVYEELLKGEVFDEARTRAIELQSKQFARARPVEGASNFSFGRLKAEIPLESFQYWEEREGRGVFAKDKAFLEHFLKHNPQCVVPARKRTIVYGWR